MQACVTVSANIASHTHNLTVNYVRRVGRNSTVGIATRYGLGIESRWGARFSLPAQTGPRAHPASYAMGIIYLRGVKLSGCGIDHPYPSSKR